MKPSADSPGATLSADIVRYDPGKELQRCEDTLVVEEPLEIRVRGRGIAVTMRTPGHDSELVAGFLLSEGIVRTRADIVEIAPCLQSDSPENTLNVFLSPRLNIDFERLTRHVFASSSCGLCGKASIETVRQSFPAIRSDVSIPASVITDLPERMRRAQPTFALTGGLHAAAVFDSRGQFIVAREDIGRHNAVDKVLGHHLLAGETPVQASVLLVSGRASFEIVQKALAGRVPIICAVSAPSSLAVEFARENGQTLIGFLREKTMNIYSGAQRVEGLAPGS